MLYATLFTRPWGPSVWLRYYTSLYPARKPADFAAYTTALRANLAEAGRLEALRHLLNASKAASEERLPRVAAPALVMMGSRDPDFKDPKAEAEWVTAALKARCELVADAGHYPHAEMPEIAGPLLLDFLHGLGGPKKVPDGA